MACRDQYYQEVVHPLAIDILGVVRLFEVPVCPQAVDVVHRIGTSARVELLKRFSAGRSVGCRRREPQTASCPEIAAASAIYP